MNTLNHIAARRGLPSIIKVDNGSEFISKVMDKWAYERSIELEFSRPGKPTDTAKVGDIDCASHGKNGYIPIPEGFQ